MKKELRGLICEIIFLCVFIVVMIPFFNNLKERDYKKTEAMLANSAALTIDADIPDNGYLIPMSDEYAVNNLKETIITIKNERNKDISYYLYLRVDKNNTVNNDNFKIKVNDEITYLTDNYNYEDETYNYYLINDNTIYDKDNIEFIMWLDDDTTNISGSFTYSFIVEENNVFAYN